MATVVAATVVALVLALLAPIAGLGSLYDALTPDTQTADLHSDDPSTPGPDLYAASAVPDDDGATEIPPELVILGRPAQWMLVTRLAITLEPGTGVSTPALSRRRDHRVASRAPPLSSLPV